MKTFCGYDVSNHWAAIGPAVRLQQHSEDYTITAYRFPNFRGMSWSQGDFNKVRFNKLLNVLSALQSLPAQSLRSILFFELTAIELKNCQMIHPYDQPLHERRLSSLN